jgi:hypothetical protein
MLAGLRDCSRTGNRVLQTGSRERFARSQKPLRRNGFPGVGNSASTLRQLCGKGCRVHLVGMKRPTAIHHSQPSAVTVVSGARVRLCQRRHARVARPMIRCEARLPTVSPYRITPDPPEDVPVEPTRHVTTAHNGGSDRSNHRIQVQACPIATSRIEGHSHLLRAAHPRPDRVRCWRGEDRRVHTCGPEPTGSLP